MSTAAAVVLFVGDHRLRDLRRRRLRRRLLGPDRRRRRARRAAARGHRPLDRAGVGGEPRLADLRLRRAVDLLPRGLRVDHADPVRAADPRGVRHRAARRQLRLPQGGVPHPGPAQLRRRLRLSSVLVPYCFGAVAGRHRLGAGARRRARPATRGTAGSTRPPILGGVLAVASTPTSPRSSWCGTPGGSPTTRWSTYFRRRAVGAGVVAGAVAFVGLFVLSRDAALPLRRTHLPGAAAGDPLGGLRRSAPLVLLLRAPRPRARLGGRRRGREPRRRLGRRAVGLPPARDAHRLRAAAPSGTITAVLVATAWRWCSSCRRSPALRARPEVAAAGGRHARRASTGQVHGA